MSVQPAAAAPPAKRAIVIGASSGIGRALALRLAREGYAVGLAARRLPLLLELQREIGPRAFVKQMDVSDTTRAMAQLEDLIAEMGGVDLVVLDAGTGHLNPDLAWQPEEETIAVNVVGFAALANVAYRHFLGRGAGHLVSISSIAALRGGGGAPAYHASKAFVSNYMDGLRHKLARLRLAGRGHRRPAGLRGHGHGSGAARLLGGLAGEGRGADLAGHPSPPQAGDHHPALAADRVADEARARRPLPSAGVRVERPGDRLTRCGVDDCRRAGGRARLPDTGP